MFQYLQSLIFDNQVKRFEKMTIQPQPFEKPRAYKNTTTSEAIKIKN